MKSASARTKTYLGVFVLIFGAVVAACVMIAGDDVGFFRRSSSFGARFTNTAGLVKGAPVRMGGVEIGRVEDIKIENSGTTPVIVATLRIDSPFFEMIQSDASVSLDTQGVLGDKFVAVSAGSSRIPLRPGETMATAQVQGMTQVMEKSQVIMDTVASTTARLDVFVAGLPAPDTLTTMTQDLAATSRAVREIMTKLSADDSLIAAFRDPEAVAALKAGLKGFQSAAEHAESVAKKIDEGQGTIGALVNDRVLYEDLRAMLGHTDRGRIARRVFRAAGATDPVPK